MSGLCGWLSGAGGGAGDAARVMRSMAGALAPAAAGRPISRSQPAAGLSVTGGWLYDDGDLCVAVEGSPVWWSFDEASRPEAASPADAVAAAYRARGGALLHHLHGSFSLAIVGRAARQALVAIDRMGVRPLYYSHTRDGLVFGTTARSVLAHPEVDDGLSPQAIFDYVYFQAVPGPSTIFERLRKLLPGQYASFEDGRLTLSSYWRPRFEPDGASIDELSSSLRSRLAVAVRRCSEAGIVGSFLSGGVDSSAVSGLLRWVSPDRPRAYSIGFDVAGYDEMEYARVAARHFGLDHVEYYLSAGDVAAAVAAVASSYDEPFGDSSALAAYYCARLASRDGVTAMLAGDGGDELFAGHIRYARQKLIASYARVPLPLRAGVIEPIVFGLPRASRVTLVRKARKYIEYARTPLPDRCEIYNPMATADLAALYTPEFLAAVRPRHPLELLREVYGETQGAHPLNRLLHLDWRFTLAYGDLRKVGRMCDLAGVGVRYPWLDDEVVELSTCVPPDLKLKRFELRYFAKYALRDVLAPETLAKHKHGFSVPYDVWLRTFPALRALAADALHDLKGRRYFNASFLDALVDEQRASGDGARSQTGLWPRLTLRVMQQSTSGHPSTAGEMVWRLMMLELWLRGSRQSAVGGGGR